MSCSSTYTILGLVFTSSCATDPELPENLDLSMDKGLPEPLARPAGAVLAMLGAEIRPVHLADPAGRLTL